MTHYDHLGQQRIDEGQSFGSGRLVYSGYGENWSACVLHLNPKAQSAPDEEFHAALWASERIEDPDHVVAWTYENLEQLRFNPEPWHCGWLVWRYRDPENFHYLILRANRAGFEYGIRHPSGKGGQVFLATSESVYFLPNTLHNVTVKSEGRRTTIHVGQYLLHDRILNVRLHNLVPPGGRVAAYSEDCHVRFDRIESWSL